MVTIAEWRQLLKGQLGDAMTNAITGECQMLFLPDVEDVVPRLGVLPEGDGSTLSHTV